MRLRTYQEDAVNKILTAFKSHNNVLLQMPTGTGKTVVFSEISRIFRDEAFKKRESCRRILILVHRDHLLTQTEESLRKWLNIESIGLIKAGKKKDVTPTILVAMVQTLVKGIKQKMSEGITLDLVTANGIKKKKYTEIPKDLSLIIVDEAHHTPAESYKTIINYYKEQGAKLLGVTGTPARLDGSGFSDVFDILIPSEQLKWFIENKYLTPYKHFATAQPNLDGIREIAGDYEEQALLKRMSEEKVMTDIVNSYIEYGNKGKAIVFAVNKKHSIEIVNRLAKEGIQANYIDSDTSPSDRKEITDNFKNGEIQVLCNVNIFTEGYDCADIDVIILARPTKSLVLYLQMIGRVLRNNRNAEKTALILDNAKLYSRHGLISWEREWTLNGTKPCDADVVFEEDENKLVKARKKPKIIEVREKMVEIENSNEKFEVQKTEVQKNKIVVDIIQFVNGQQKIISKKTIKEPWENYWVNSYYNLDDPLGIVVLPLSVWDRVSTYISRNKKGFDKSKKIFFRFWLNNHELNKGKQRDFFITVDWDYGEIDIRSKVHKVVDIGLVDVKDILRKSQRKIAIQLLMKDAIIHEEVFRIKNLPDDLRTVVKKLLQFKNEKLFEFDEVIIDGFGIFIRNKIGTRQKWVDWKGDNFHYNLIQDRMIKNQDSFSSGFLFDKNNEFRDLKYCFNILYHLFVGRLVVSADNLYSISTLLKGIKRSESFYLQLKSPYFDIDFYQLDIPFPYKEIMKVAKKINLDNPPSWSKIYDDPSLIFNKHITSIKEIIALIS
jgi:superfamily II DNA or RNA helicase